MFFLAGSGELVSSRRNCLAGVGGWQRLMIGKVYYLTGVDRVDGRQGSVSDEGR